MHKVIWSVQTNANSFNDDLFTGTLTECYEYCVMNDIMLDYYDARLAQILVDDDGDFIETLGYQY